MAGPSKITVNVSVEVPDAAAARAELAESMK